MSFESLQLIEPIKKAIKEKGYITPTPIQQRSIPPILEQKDLLGCAQTGTGKTAAFAIPILQLLAGRHTANSRPGSPKALILTPTRELAIQIAENLNDYGRYMRLRHLVIFGGVSQAPQVQQLQRGIDILVATPGRLLDLISQRFISLSEIEIFVLDEADRMLDMGFVNDVKKVITRLPARRQTLFFSATMPEEIRHLSAAILNNPVRVEVTPPSTTADTVQQALYYVEKGNKKLLLSNLLKDPAIATCLVFTRTKHGADKVVKDLLRSGITAEAIHGNKSQNARQRALTNFKARTTRVLVATDIAARGIDIDELSHVINYELPNVPETYIHRIGRTGRAGNEGTAFSFCDAEELPYLKDIHKLMGKTIPSVEHPLQMDIPLSSPVSQHPSQKNVNGARDRRGYGQHRNFRSSRPSGQSRPALTKAGDRQR